MKRSTGNTLRIIGGECRGRKLTFPDNPQLRPTPDRVRETLFNWLQNDIYGACCLDLFAGSGALGLEALSRGAKECVFVETHAPTCKQLKQNLHILKKDNYQIACMDALTFLKQTQASFDIVFIDPPFANNLWQPALNLLLNQKLLAPNGKLYLESHSKTVLNLPEQWQILRDKKAGDVHYQLISLGPVNTHSKSALKPQNRPG